MSAAFHHARAGADIARDRWNAADMLAAALAALSSELPPQRFAASGAYAQGGKPFVMISSGVCATAAKAIECWTDRFLEFVTADTGDVLWWRARPTITGEVDCDSGGSVWTVYARCALGAEG